MNFKRITLEKCGGGITATVDGMYAEKLTQDEALAVVASALFGNGDTRPFYVQTAEEHRQRAEKYGVQPEEKPEGDA